MSRGWRSVIGAWISCMAAITPYALLSVFLIPVTLQYGVSRGEASLIFTFAGIGSLVANLFVGSLLDRIHPRIVYLIGACFVLAFYSTLAFSTSIIFVYIVALLYGVATIFAGFVTAQSIIAKWVGNGRGAAISLTNMLTSLLTVCMVPVITRLIEKIGFVSTAMYVGIAASVIIALSALFLISHMPDYYGMQQISFGKIKQAKESKFASGDMDTSLPISKIIKMPVFYCAIICSLFLTCAGMLYNSNAIPFYISIGLSAESAALAFSIFTFTKIGAAFLFGVLCDRLGPVRTIVIYCLVGGIPFLFNKFIAGFGFVGAVILSILVTTSNISGMHGSNLFPKMFGIKNSSQLISYAHLFCSIGAMIGPPFAGFIFDSTGSYTIALITGGILLLLTAVFTVISCSKKSLEKIKAEDQKYVAEQQIAVGI